MHELVVLDLSQVTVRAGVEVISSNVLAIIGGVRVLCFTCRTGSALLARKRQHWCVPL